MIYRLVVILLILFLWQIFINHKQIFASENSAKKWFVILVSIILILQSGLRHVAVGADTYAYYHMFESVKEMSWADIGGSIYLFYIYDVGVEPGYTALKKLFQYISGDYQLFLIFIALLFFPALGNFLLKNTTKMSDLVLAFVLYSVLFYSFFSITGHRQTLATAAILLSFELIKSRKLFPFILILAVASTVHISALVFFPLYFLIKFKRVKLLFVTIVLLFPFLFEFREPISNFFKEVGGFEEYRIYEGAGTFTFTLMLMLVAFVGLWRYRSTIKLFPESRFFFVALIIAVFFTPLTWVNPSAMRVVQYFSLFLMVLLPAVINSFSVGMARVKVGVFAMVIILLLALFIRVNIDGGHSAEYKFFWQEMELGPNY